MQPASPAAFRLLMEGGIALAACEARGVRIDTAALADSMAQVSGEIKELTYWLKSQPEYELQRKRNGQNTNLTSREQLAKVLFGDMGLPYYGTTGAKGQFTLDDEDLKAVGTPYTETYRKLMKLDKLRGTYLEGVSSRIMGGRLHCFFNLQTVITYRSSAEDPNLQNVPIRDPAISYHIRRAFVPDPGCVLVELDYSGAEVKVAACYHKDPTMIEYILTDHDMHADMARECFLLPAAKPVPKPARNAAKGSFVFAEFYGDYFKAVAVSLWSDARELGLLPGLAAAGINDLPTYIEHIKKVEHRFWKVRFPVYDKWREKWWRAYLEWGHFHTLTGFRVHGNFIRNEVINNPVQGSAFHCLLQSLVEIRYRVLASKMRSRVVGQIHDSLLCNVPYGEVAEFTAMAREVMVHWLARQWPWLIVPMAVEAEASDANWHAKKPLEIGVDYE